MLYVINANGRIVSTRETNARSGPLLSLIRSNKQCAWAVHASVPDNIASEIEALVRQEPPVQDFQGEPLYAQTYISLLKGSVEGGPVFIFPDVLSQSSGVVTIKDIKPLEKNLRGWAANEIESCSPILAVVEEGNVVSACFCARRSEVAAEAGLDTAENWRGRGFAAQVTAAWAQAIRAERLLPVYSTDWDNHASRAVARKLGLIEVASNWKVVSAA